MTHQNLIEAVSNASYFLGFAEACHGTTEQRIQALTRRRDECIEAAIAGIHEPSQPAAVPVEVVDRAHSLLRDVGYVLDHKLEVQSGSAIHHCIYEFLAALQPQQKGKDNEQ